jgi:hypothetical protein
MVSPKDLPSIRNSATSRHLSRLGLGPDPVGTESQPTKVRGHGAHRMTKDRNPTLLRIPIGLLCLLLFFESPLTANDAPQLAKGEVVRVARRPDPYGAPRPSPGEEHVPLATSLYLELAVLGGALGDAVDPESVSISLQPARGEPISVLEPGIRFGTGYSGRLFPGKKGRDGDTLAVYAEGDQPLLPATRYAVRIDARSQHGAALASASQSWQFTTEAEPEVHGLSFELDLQDEARVTAWQGGFFSGFCGTSFATNHKHRIPTFELMDQVRQSSPRAWSLQRDFWLTGMERQPRLLPHHLPGIVRELETRRIVAIEPQGEHVRLRLEDFFGHQQYGIASDRPLAGDYRPGDQVLIADGVHDARTRVVSVDDSTRSVIVTEFETPEGGWKLDYAAPLPEQEDPDSPGLFPPGGCYLIKFDPVGTPKYFWRRLDHEWDLAILRFGRRVMVNFTDAPGDLAIDGRNWTTAKDYAQLHQVVHAITTHLIDRYGDRCLEFPWSVFNEPDLGALFWRSDWIELQKFYDYTVDAVLRAFEDRGYDSQQVFIGGLELGAIFGTNLRLREFLVHCSPRAAEVKGALMKNAAFADPRLDGKRSQRVEMLCRAHGGRGSPCDFISIHAYNTSQLMADKLVRAKELALEIDPEYYADLWINSHESCPGWDMPPDPAFADSYLGNGYYPTWCADVTRRRLAQAAIDPRYGYGETILTFWPWPARDFEGRNDCVREVRVDDTGDGLPDRTITLPMPILHFLGLLNRMQDRFQVLPERTVGGHVVSGFASRVDSRWYVLVYAHQMLDTQSRSGQQFDVTLELRAPARGPVAASEYRFDKQHNSYFEPARRLRDQPDPRLDPSPEVREQFRAAMRGLESPDRQTRFAALDEIERLDVAGNWVLIALFEFFQQHDEPELRERAIQLAQRISAPRAHRAAEIEPIAKLAKLQQTRTELYEPDATGRLELHIPLSGNAASFWELRTDETP